MSVHPLLMRISRTGRVTNNIKKGVVRKCAFCAKEIYLPPSKAMYKKSYCKGHAFKDAFNFPCEVCAKKIYTQPAQLKYRSRRTCSRECRRILARKEVQEKRQGYTKHQLDRLARYSFEAREWREAVFKRDDYTCQMCGVRGTYLEADHLKPWAYFPELRYKVNNGRTLCRPCHDTTKISAKEMREIYGNKKVRGTSRSPHVGITSFTS